MTQKTGLGPRKKLTPSAVWRAAVQEKAVKYYLQGNTTLKAVAERISQELPRGCSLSTVYETIQAALKDWTEQNTEAINDYKRRELLKIENLEREAWDAWVRSCQPEKIRQTKSVPVGKHKATSKRAPVLLVTEIIDNEREGAGNKRFLDTVQWCITKRYEIMASLQTPTNETDKPGAITNNTTIRQIVFKGRRQEGAIQTVIINDK